jgi:hypothetical protein
VDCLVITNWMLREIDRGLVCYSIFTFTSTLGRRLLQIIRDYHSNICQWLNLLRVVKLLNYDFSISIVVDTDTDFYREKFIFKCL